MKSPKEDYEIRKSVVSDLRTREDLLNFFSFYTLVIYHVIISRSNKCNCGFHNPLSGISSSIIYITLHISP